MTFLLQKLSIPISECPYVIGVQNLYISAHIRILHYKKIPSVCLVFYLYLLNQHLYSCDHTNLAYYGLNCWYCCFVPQHGCVLPVF